MLCVLYKYLDMMFKFWVDKGVIKFVIFGANIMCSGLTSSGATMYDECEEDELVVIYVEGKEYVLVVGIMKMSMEVMWMVNKGIGVDLVYYLKDGLWEATAK